MIYAQQWYLRGDYEITAQFTFLGDRPAPGENDSPEWKMYNDGHGLMGLAIGAKSLFESYGQVRNATPLAWTDNNQLCVMRPKGQGSPQGGLTADRLQPSKSIAAPKLKPGDRVKLVVKVSESNSDKARVLVTLTVNDASRPDARLSLEVAKKQTEGFFGVIARGLIDFEVNRISIDPGNNQPRQIGVADCLVCYPLGDTLCQIDEAWRVKFVGMFASDGKQVEIRVAKDAKPEGGWESVPVCGRAQIVNNKWRRHTAVIDVELPNNPAEATLYYTIWKDGHNVTADGRIGTDACGPGTGLVGDVPGDGHYVGRLPQLKAPYKLCGLSCHAIQAGLQTRTDSEGWTIKGGGGEWMLRDQPSVESYRHLEDYEFQVMVWEDDVWYMELVLYPPSTDDAYKIIALSIAGPTSRWQMMRHWNVINPGDHDYGMDDVKGPEQIIIRSNDGLGQDAEYMRRNFQIVHHLTTGAEIVDPLENPKKWRAWKMPDHDFTFIVLDSRLWRSSQDVDIWDDHGWDQFKSLYGRTDPTRSLLGEEQFAWLQQRLSTDSSPLIAMTGINGMHTVWTGTLYRESFSSKHPKRFSQRDRVTADYAGWVKAGADRVLELLGGRTGVVSVYGDVHNGCIMTNDQHRVVECSFGPIGRSGGRSLIPGFGRSMKDVDERDLQVHALYHKQFADPDQSAHDKGEPFYWNFLEMEFDPSSTKQTIAMKIRNLVDDPSRSPRGGGDLTIDAADTGRPPTSYLPRLQTIQNADVFLSTLHGRPLRGIRSDERGQVQQTGLVDIDVGTKLIATATDGERSDAQIIETV